MSDNDHQMYLDERRLLVEGEVQVAARFDKSILTLSGGALLLSMTFVKDIVSGSPNDTWALIVSWILLGMAIAAMLTSLLTSQRAYQRQRDILDKQYGSRGGRDECNWWAWSTKWLNRISITIFLVAIFFLGYFSIKNVEKSLGGQNEQVKTTPETEATTYKKRCCATQATETTWWG